MTAILALNFRDWMAVSGFVALLFTGSFSQADRASRARSPSVTNEETSRFIVAFELTEENGFTFTWPFESMRPSSYETVVMVVDTMPRVRDGNSDNEFESMIASRDLKINGRRRKPSRIANKQTYFVVRLDQGRLRLSLSIPVGMNLDPEHNVARIKLYEQ